jgi:outer membrane protein
MRLRMMWAIWVAILAATILTPAAWSQTAAAPAMKFGVINVQAALQSTAEGKLAGAELQSQFAPRQAELQNMQKQIGDDEARLRAGQATLGDEEKYRLQREMDTLNRSLQRKNQDATDDFNQATQDMLNRLGRKLIAVIEKYSKENGYGIILDTSSQQTPVMYAANQIDITQDIVRLYDQSYPVKASTAAPTPRPAPKPAPVAPGTPATPKP